MIINYYIAMMYIFYGLWTGLFPHTGYHDAEAKRRRSKVVNSSSTQGFRQVPIGHSFVRKICPKRP